MSNAAAYSRMIAAAPRLDTACLPDALRAFAVRPPSDVLFRAREPEDLAGLFDLFAEPAFCRDVLTCAPFATPSHLTEWFAGHAMARPYEIVAVAGARVVGFGALFPLAGHMRHTGSLMLGVSAAAQRLGIGSFLLRLLLMSAWAAAGLEKVQLTTFTDNVAALALYRKAGFEIEGRIRRFTRDGSHSRDAFAMALFLDDTGEDVRRS